MVIGPNRCQGVPGMNNLLEFYKAYADWLDAESPIVNPCKFFRESGLCDNLKQYLKYVGADIVLPVEQAWLHSALVSAGLNGHYPFNRDAHDYYAELRCDLNEARRQWVYDRVER